MKMRTKSLIKIKNKIKMFPVALKPQGVEFRAINKLQKLDKLVKRIMMFKLKNKKLMMSIRNNKLHQN